MAPDETARPLDGITVLDFSQYEAGPTCTMLLAWMGARVVKVERPGRGDPARQLWRDEPDLDSFYFSLMNANKESIEVDLKDDEDLELLLDLLEETDVVVENFSPGVMERLGLDYETVSETHPELIYASIKGFGSYGPWKEYKSFDQIAQATSGVTSLTGYADRPPVRSGAVVGDTGAGMMAAIGILAAIHDRERSGEGQHVEVSQQDAALFFTRTYLTETLATGEPVERAGNDIDGIVPSGMYPCKPNGPNDFLVVHMAIADESTWDRFFEIIGKDDVAGDERYYDVEFRTEREEAIDQWLTEWTQSRTKQEAMTALAEAGVPCGAVLDTEEVLENEQLRQRDMVQFVDHPERGKHRVVGCPIKLSRSSVDVRPSPLLGEDTDDVLGSGRH